MSLFYFLLAFIAHLHRCARAPSEGLLALVSDLPNELHNITRDCRRYVSCARSALLEESSYRYVALAANPRQILARLRR